jgi:hypothetical protein
MHHPGAHPTNRLHPVRGIGWVGIVGIAFFLILAIGELLSPLGLRYEVLRLIAERTPSQSGKAILVASTIAIVGMNAYVYVSFGVLSLLYLLPAFWIAPRQRTVVRFILIPLWCVIESFALYSPWFWIIASHAQNAFGFGYHEYIPVSIAVIGHAILLWTATGRVYIAVTLLGVIAASVVWNVAAPWFRVPLNYGVLHSLTTHEISFQNAAFMALPWCFLLIHGMMAFVMIRWALRERRRASDPHACHACGYSLEGITSNICPECGGTRAA